MIWILLGFCLLPLFHTHHPVVMETGVVGWTAYLASPHSLPSRQLTQPLYSWLPQ